MNIGDKVTYKHGKLRGVELRISSVNCDRCVVERLDSHGIAWFRYANMKDLEKVKIDT